MMTVTVTALSLATLADICTQVLKTENIFLHIGKVFFQTAQFLNCRKIWPITELAA
jgi:hypothetical protein